MNPLFQNTCLLTGRTLLGLYFILPGVMKVADYAGTASYMAAHEVPMIQLLLPLTIVLQIGLGVLLILGAYARISGFILAGLTLVISVYMHNFWDMPGGADRAHETQNFIKNLAIMAGLLLLPGLGAGAYSIDRRRGRDRD